MDLFVIEDGSEGKIVLKIGFKDSFTVYGAVISQYMYLYLFQNVYFPEKSLVKVEKF